MKTSYFSCELHEVEKVKELFSSNTSFKHLFDSPEMDWDEMNRNRKIKSLGSITPAQSHFSVEMGEEELEVLLDSEGVHPYVWDEVDSDDSDDEF